MVYVEKVRKYQDVMELKEAITKAIDECIAELEALLESKKVKIPLYISGSEKTT